MVLSKYIFTILFAVVHVLFLGNVQAQAYTDYEASDNTDALSYEGIPAYYASELKPSRRYLKTLLKEDLNSNFITEAVVNYRILKKQLKYLKKEEYDFEQIRICKDTFDALPIDRQKKHLRIIHHLAKKFAISRAEYNVLKSTITYSRKETKNQRLKKEIDVFERYIDLAFELRYSKLEIFRDCTGYWKPESILHKQSFRQVLKACMNWKHFKHIYRDPFDYASKTAQHGLKATEAVRRLEDIKSCVN